MVLYPTDQVFDSRSLSQFLEERGEQMVFRWEQRDSLLRLVSDRTLLASMTPWLTNK